MAVSIIEEAAGSAVGKRERTRRHIYDCAVGLFSAKGYAATTVGDICQAAGISRATFFLHFKEKAALVGEGSRRLGALWESRRGDLGELPAHEILRHLIWFIYDNMESPDIAAPMLDDFRHTFGGDMSPGTGPGTIHAYTSDVIHAAQLEGSVMASPAADVLAHHAIRLTSLYRMFMVGDHNETKLLLWRLFYTGARQA